MSTIDLHIHTTASDGSLTPAEIAREAQRAGLCAFAVTDHDTVAGLPEAATAAAGLGLEFVPGVELAVKHLGRSMDILGLWLPLVPQTLADKLAWLNEERGKRNRRIVEKLRSLGVDLTYDEVKELAGGTIGRPHIAKALVQKGAVDSVQQAFDRYIADGGKANVPKQVLAPREAVELLAGEGATVILAHPGMYKIEPAELEQTLREFKEYGLEGIECFHPEHDAVKTHRCLHLAEKYGLVVSGGSDFHGAAKPGIKLGVGRGNLRLGTDILEALKSHRQARGQSV